jgi:tetratricopeptide (TPR) repeat protein
MTANSGRQTIGERGIGIQITGDANTVIVYAGLTELSLVRKHLRKAEPKTELQLLRVDLRATTLVGRESDRSALEVWLASDRLISVRCITGRAGVGKTRLAIELCEHAEQAGWTAGFAQYGQSPEFVERAAEWRWDRPTLVVIDYAAALARDLRTWLEILARPEAQASENKLRLLLLERHAERDLGWWADLLRPVSFSDPGPDELADPPEPVPLRSLAAVEDRRALLAEAMRLAGQIAGPEPIPRPPLLGANADFDRRLGDDAINNEPLYLMMAGAEAIGTGALAALSLTRTDLAQRAANRERERLNRLALQWGLPEKLVAHLAMCVTLQGGCSAEEALQLILEERQAAGFPETNPVTDLVNRLAEALPILSGAEVDAVRPDLIGEAFLLDGMRENRRFPELQTEIVERAWRRASGKVTGTLIRTAQDFARGDASHCSVVWLGHLVDQIDDLAALTSLGLQLPEQTVTLRELAAVAQERISSALAEKAAGESGLRPFLAGARNNLAIRLSDLGRREEALAAAEEATTLYRELAAQRRDAFQPDLAGSLNSLAKMLSDLGRREPALATAEEAAALYRELAAQRPDAFRPDLAASLNSLANTLSALGRREPALAMAEEAAALYRELAAERPEAFRPDLARSLNSLANRLSDLGRREEALAAAEEATTLYRELAVQRRDAFRPDLAGSLNSLAKMLSDLGRREPALATAEEAAALYRELAAQRPDAFRPDLAASLNNLANTLSALGRREPALAMAEEAAALYRELAEQRPDAFRPNLAVSLAVQANCLDALDRSADALAANIEAITALSEAFIEQPAAFGHWMGPMVWQYLERCERLGQKQDMEVLGPIVAILQDQHAQTKEDPG